MLIAASTITAATEIHVVGGLHHLKKFDWYVDVIHTIHETWPAIHIKAWTAVEINWFAHITKQPYEWVLEQMLDQAGFQVQVVQDGALGVGQFQQWRPHFIWMDWRMPVMDGKAFLKWFRNQPSPVAEVPILVVTAATDANTGALGEPSVL